MHIPERRCHHPSSYASRSRSLLLLALIKRRCFRHHEFWTLANFFFMTMIGVGSAWSTSPTILSSVSSRAASTFQGLQQQFIIIPSRARTQRRSFSQPSFITMMPEGPEVRTLVDQLQGGIGKRLIDIQFQSGRYVSDRPPGFVEFAKTMTPLWSPPHAYEYHEDGDNLDIIRQWNCKGKFIYVVLDDGARKPTNLQNATTIEDDSDYQRSIWITLGMTGRFVNEAAHLQDPSFCRWFFELIDPSKASQSRATPTKIYYHDQRNFGTLRFSLSKSELEKKLASLGPDVLGGAKGTSDESVDALTQDKFLSIVSQQKPTLNICKFLMDQSKLAGVGNYILSEALYRANIDPFASLQELNESQQVSLFEQVQAVSNQSYMAQGMTRYKSGAYRTVDGTRGKFEFELQCYGREKCAKGRPVIRETNGPHQRSIWYVEDQLFMPRKERKGDMVTVERPKRKLEGTNPDVGDPSAGQQPVHHSSSHCITFDNLIDGLTEPSWETALEPYISTSDSFQQLQEFLKQEQTNGQTIYPPPQNVFAALNLCPLNQTKVVILGQDPYHGPNQGTGLAFSVNQGIAIPPSLKNIFKEAMEDVGIDPPAHGNLESWAHQGVLMLNTVLTVRRGQANSHAKRGWEDFTDEVVRILSEREDKIVYLLWGRPAAQKAGKVVDVHKHVVISTSHPSPLGATKTAAPFLTSRCFSRANDALEELGKEPVDWNVR